MYKQQQTMASDKLNDKDALETDVSEITTVNNNTTQNATGNNATRIILFLLNYFLFN